MNCTCRKDLEAKLNERFKALNQNASEHEVRLLGYGISISAENTLYEVGLMPAEATAMYPIKNGGVKKKTTRLNMPFRYCPFCGVKGN